MKSLFLLLLLLPVFVSGQVIETIAGNGVAGYSGDGGAAILCELDNPDYLVFDHATNIYIADEHNHVVRKVNTSGIITTIAGNGFGAGLSDGGYSGDNGPATAAMLSRPSTVGIDRAGNIYITEFGNNTIRKVTPSGIISTIAGTGIAGYSGDNGPATAAQFNTDVNCSAIDAYGNLYIADPNNNRIRRIVFDETAVNNVYKQANKISIYPNPAQNEVTIKSTTAIASVEVVNMMGQVVVAPFGKASGQAASSKEVLLDIRSLPAGVYFVKVNGPDGYRDGGRFLKE